MLYYAMAIAMRGWELFFHKLLSLLCSVQRQHGAAKEAFGYHVLERIEISRGS